MAPPRAEQPKLGNTGSPALHDAVESEVSCRYSLAASGPTVLVEDPDEETGLVEVDIPAVPPGKPVILERRLDLQAVESLSIYRRLGQASP
jgi:hypothetical protein